MSRAGRHEWHTCASAMAAAFHTDPAFVYIVPDPEERMLRLRRFFQVILQEESARGRVDVGPGDCGAAMWLRLGGSKVTSLSSLGVTLRLAAVFGRRTPRGLLVDALVAKHLPRQAGWYLHFLGVEPSEQGRGRGSALLELGLRTVDEEGATAWLETELSSNVSFYEKFGFRVVTEYDVPAGGPHFWGMSRAARPTASSP